MYNYINIVANIHIRIVPDCYPCAIANPISTDTVVVNMQNICIYSTLDTVLFCSQLGINNMYDKTEALLLLG